MPAVPDKVLNWLYSVLTREYYDVNRAYSDVAQTLSRYPSFSPRTEVYTYENGASALLLLLSGTLPVSFRGTVYRFPVNMWVPHAYPKEPPIVYVTPTQGMLVRPGQHVAGDGRVYHPYLAQWGRHWDKSSITDFLAVLRGIFAKEPPVISKQQDQRYAPPIQATPPPVPPPPEEWRRSMQSPQTASPVQLPTPPPKPPKPHEASTDNVRSQPPLRPIRAGDGPPLPPLPPQLPDGRHGAVNDWQRNGSAQQFQQASQYVPQRHSGLNGGPPPLPPQPHATTHPAYNRIQEPQYELESPVSPVTPEGSVQPPKALRYEQPLSAPQPQPSYAQQQMPMGPPQNNHLQHQPVPNHHGPAPPSISRPTPQQFQQQLQQPPPPKPAQPALDLLSSPLDITLPSQTGNAPPIPAPPIPPNPEKDALLTALSTTLLSQLRSTLSSNATALPALLAQQQALRDAHSRLASELESLQQLDGALASNERILRDAMREADRVMEGARRRKAPDVDEVLVAPTVVGGQLYGLCAEERALEDARVAVARGVDRGRVGVDVFIKQTRSLAREEFLKKALTRKIARGLGLDEEVRR